MQQEEDGRWLAKVRFVEELEKEPEWADNLLKQVQPGSDLWKMHYPSITKLFNASTAMEDVSLRLWNLYRQQNHPAVQGEAQTVQRSPQSELANGCSNA